MYSKVLKPFSRFQVFFCLVEPFYALIKIPKVVVYDARFKYACGLSLCISKDLRVTVRLDPFCPVQRRCYRDL